MTTATSLVSNEIRVYWQPGCTSCLRTKEFLTRHGIPFASRNVLGDDQAFEELAHFGLRQVPIVTKGESWANGQVLADVAKLVASMPGAEVARHENGRLVVVFETERDDDPLIQLDRIALLDGVALISPIYHRIEPLSSLEFPRAGA